MHTILGRRKRRDRRKSSPQSRVGRLRKSLAFEGLEQRALLAADYLYSLEARAGVPKDGFGFAHAANDQFQIVSNIRFPDASFPGATVPGFYGEIQVHDAATGALLRTIPNPFPYSLDEAGTMVPNAFGFAVDIEGDKILVGSPGWEGQFIDDAIGDPTNTLTGGRAFLFDANTGDLLMSVDSYERSEFTRHGDNDGFGRSVAIEGNFLAIAAHGPSYLDPQTSHLYDDLPGSVSIYNWTNLENIYDPTDLDYVDFITDEPVNENLDVSRDFGTSVSLSNGKLVVTQGLGVLSPIGPTLVYDMATDRTELSEIIHTLSGHGLRAVIQGNTIAVALADGTTQLFDATSGTLINTIPAQFQALDGSLIVTGQSGSGPNLELDVRDSSSGNVLYSVPAPPSFVGAAWQYNQTPQVAGNRLFVPGRQGSATNNVLFVYSVTDGSQNSPPSDIAITNNSVPENSADGTVVGILSATDPDAGESFTFTLVSSASGRFEIVGSQLRVANGSLLNFEANTSHNITVQVTDSTGNTYTEVLQIQVTNANEPPTSIALSSNTVSESTVQLFRNLDPQGNHQFGRSLDISNNRLLISDTFETSPGNVQNRVHVRDATTGENLTTLLPPNAQADPARFGSSLALSGNIAVVASVFEEVGSVDSAGAVYLFDIVTGNHLRTLVSPSLASNRSFGQSVAISGNLVAVSSYVEGLNDWVIDLFNVTTGALLETISNPMSNFDGAFFAKVLISGDRIIVGSTSTDTSAVNTGRVYVFNFNAINNSSTLENVIENPLPVADDQFGNSMAVSNNLLAVNSGGTSGGISFPGVVHLFDLTSGAYLRSLANPNPSALDFLGLSLSISGDYVFASSSTNNAGQNTGTVYVFQASSGKLISTLNNPSPTANDNFGSRIIAVGNRVYISAPSDDADGLNYGRVYAYNLAYGQTIGTLSATDPDVGDTFTFSLLGDADGRFAILGDQIVVADATKLDFETDPVHFIFVRVTDSAGNVRTEPEKIQLIDVNEAISDLSLLDHRVVEQSPNGALVAAIDNPSPLLNDSFGNMVSSSTRLLASSSKDPEAHIFDATSLELLHTLQLPKPGFFLPLAITDAYAIVGNASDDTLGVSAGAVYIFDVNTGVLLKTLYRPPSDTVTSFGRSVAVMENSIAIGTGVGNSGESHVFLYDLVTGNLLKTLSSPLSSEIGFGVSVALSDQNVLVGQTTNAGGSVHVYDLVTGDFIYSIDNPSPNSGDGFGTAIRAVENRILISAPGDDTVGDDTGAVYLFNATTADLIKTFLPTSIATNAFFGSSLDIQDSRIAVGTGSSARAYFYDAITFALIQELPDVHVGNEGFGGHLDFGGDRLFVSGRVNRGASNSGEIQVFDSLTGNLLPGVQVTPNDIGDVYTFTLLDNAGGRFALNGNQLMVANGAAIDYETATSHTVTIQVTDSIGSTLTKTLTINVVDANDKPTNISLSNSTVSESSVRWIHNLNPQTDRLFGTAVAVDGNRMLVNEFASQATGRVLVIDSTTGEQSAVLIHPNPVSNQISVDGFFGLNTAISGNLAIVSAHATNVGNAVLAGAVYIYNATTGALMHTLSSPTPAQSVAFGQAISAYGNLVAIGSLDGPQSSGVVYLFNASTGALLTTIANPDPDAAVDLFGASLAFNGETLVVAASQEIVGGQPAGQAYIYHINPVTFTASLVSTINNPVPGDAQFFGGTLASAGEIVAIASHNEDAGAVNAGAVYLYEASTGNFLRKLVDPSPAVSNLLGRSLAIKGRYVIAGSQSTDSNNGGTVKVFDTVSGELVATIANPSPNNLDSFGDAIAVDGNRILISDPGDDTDGANQGMVYAYDLAFGETVGTLTTTDSDLADSFTYTLIDSAGGRFAIDGDKLIIVNATKLDFEASSTHDIVVQVIDSAGNSFSKVIPITINNINEPPKDLQLSNIPITKDRIRFLHNPAAAKGTTFGYVTASDGDRIVVGTNKTVNKTGEVVYVFHAQTGELISTIVSPAPQAGELFGEQVAISGNLVLVSARNKDVNGIVDVGQVYVFDATTGGLLQTLNHPSPAVNSDFGKALALTGNLAVILSNGKLHLFNPLTGSFLQTLTPGAPTSVGLSGNTIVVGGIPNTIARVYEFNPTTQLATATVVLNNPSLTPSDGFGFHEVNVKGNTIAIAAITSDIDAFHSGIVHLFDRETGIFLRTIHNPSPATSDGFGSSMASNGIVLAIASASDDTDAAHSGRVYLFDISTGELLNTILNPSPGIGDLFGGVSFAGNRLVVASNWDDTDGNDTGMVYVYDLTVGEFSSPLTTSDPDQSESFTYTLLDDLDGRFALQGNSLIATSLIANENAPSYSLPIRVEDSNGLASFELLTVQVVTASGPPTNITFVGNSVVERATNQTVVSTLATADPNAGDTFTYSLLNSAGGRFGIVGNTIVVNNGVAIDFETSPAHSVMVQVTDSSGLSTFESFRITVTDAPETFDFGDLPATFGTTLASNGARHERFLGSPRLGASASIDNDGQPSATASLDTFDDGVTLPALLIPNLNAVFTVTASQAGKLDAFIDFGGNGNFSESERITPVGGLTLVAGVNTFTASIPATAASGNRGARFRFSTAGGLGPTGVAVDGEVEDYRIDVLAPANLSSQLLPDPENPGQTLMFVRGSALNDIIAVDPVGAGLRATINGVQGATLAAPNRIVMYGVSGNDDLRINTTTIPGYIDGGLGDDTIRGGNGPDQLFGRAGNDIIFGRGGIDLIYGSSGNDQLFSDSGAGILFGEGNDDILVGTGILVGGDGVDTLTGTGSRNLLIGGNNGDNLTGANIDQGDILIAGFTAYDANVDALYALHNEWRFNAPVLDRIAHLNGTTTGGLNGTFRLDETTVFVENQVDAITNFGTTNPLRDDWVFISAGDVKVNPPGIVVIVDGVLNGSPEGTWPEILSIYTNYSTPADVNFDDQITPLDALVLIDGLNRRLRGPVAKFPPGEELYLDVSDDLEISPLDVLLVIDQLNRRTSQPTIGEGEASADPTVQDMALTELSADWDFDLRNRRRMEWNLTKR